MVLTRLHCIMDTVPLLAQFRLARNSRTSHTGSVLSGKEIATGQMRNPPRAKGRKAPSTDLLQVEAKAMVDTCIG